MRRLSCSIAVAALALLTLIPAQAQAACSNPAGAEGEMIYNADQNVHQICNGADWIALGTLNPAAGGAGCSNPAADEATIIYNNDIHAPQYCDGDDWRLMIGSGSGAGVFGFSHLIEGGTSTQYSSNILQSNVGGSISLSGDGSPQYRICSDYQCVSEFQTWGSSAGTISNGQFVQLRMTSNATQGVTNTATVKIGGVNNQWKITNTDPPTGCPTIGDVCSDGTIYAGLTPDGNVAMYTTTADQGTAYWNNGNSSNYTTTSQTSNITGEANSLNLLSSDSDSGTSGTQPHVAAQVCADLIINGRDDWYLPAKNEIEVLYTNKAAGSLSGTFDETGSFPAGYYWTSTEVGSGNAKSEVFSNGGDGTSTKQQAHSVRCVRK